MEERQYKELRVALSSMDADAIALLLTEMPDAETLTAFRLLPKDLAVQVFDQFDGRQQLALMELFTDNTARRFLEVLPPDDRAELFDEVPAALARRLLRLLSPQDRQMTLKLLGYAEDSAGRAMTPDFVDLQEKMTAAEALDKIRRLAVSKETIYMAYVINRQRKLIGTVSLKDLVLAEPRTCVTEIMTDEPRKVYTDTDQEEVGRLLKDYELLAIPVVDAENRLVGIITWDDVVDIMEEEATEDIYRFGAVPGSERAYFTDRIWSVVRRRTVWLLLLIFANTFTATIIAGQEELLAELVIMAAFIPLLIGTGGNIGAQSATVVIRGMATGEIAGRRKMSVVLREGGVGLLLGLVLGLVVLAWAYLLGRDFEVALIVMMTLMLLSTLATLTGASLPFFFQRLKIDPALVSAPFITTVMDVLGVALYFAIAAWLLGL